MLKWKNLDEETFNRLVEQLIRRDIESREPGLEVTAFDGRGGDGGIDIKVQVKSTKQLVHIYQLKYFTDGFSGGQRPRRKQIKKSFDTAMQHNPEAWYLVFPANITPNEEKYLATLRGEHRVSVRFLDMTKLDLILAKYPELHDYAIRNDLEAALERGRVAATSLSHPEDLDTEIRRLALRSDARSDYWQWDFARTGNSTTHILRALRPDASEREPLHVTPTLDFSTEPELSEQFQDMLGYGALNSLTLPPTVVTRIEQSGPEWFRDVVDNPQLELHPAGEEDFDVVVSILSENGKQLAKRRASARATFGAKGGKLATNIGPGFLLTFRFERDDRENCRISMERRLAGVTSVQARTVARFEEKLTPGRSIQIEGGEAKFSVRLDDNTPTPNSDLLFLADDLAFIEEQLDVEFEFPESLENAEERIWIRLVRMILEGEVGIVPRVDGYNVVMNAEKGSGQELLLKEGGAIRITGQNLEVEILDQVLTLEELTILHPHVLVENGEDHLAAIQSGEAKGRRARLVPADPTVGFRVYAPSKMRDTKNIDPKPWDIPGVREHGEFQRDDQDEAP